MANRYFVCEKWNYAPAARRKANKALTILEHAKDFMANTHDREDVWFDCPAYRDAMQIFAAAGKRVAQWEDAQHAAAKARA